MAHMHSRKDPLREGEVYHVFSRSIAGFRVFNNASEFMRMMGAVRYYQKIKPVIRFSEFLRLSVERQIADSVAYQADEKLVDVIAFCLMPTHVHLIVKQRQERGTSIYMSNVLNSYTRYFNVKHRRKGPLWEGRFKNVLVKSSEQVLHLTRYIHLNPVTAYLVNEPAQWHASSYHEYVEEVDEKRKTCSHKELIKIDPAKYRDFVQDNINYQRDLGKIKNLLLE
jgi:putative transposase